MITRQLSNMSRWSQERYRQDGYLCVDNIRREIIRLMVKIESEARERGSLAMLGELSLAPFLEEGQ